MPKEVVGVGQMVAVVGWSKEGEHVQVATILKDDPEDGWYVDLNRAEINRLIKALRTARDQAYGRDE